MHQFVYFSRNAATSGNALSGDLMKAGRMDIAVHSIIAGFFLSHDFRHDVKMHLIFYGMPDPPKHIEMQVTPELDISKKDVAGLIKKILYKYREGKRTEVLPGCFVEKKSFLQVVGELEKGDGKIFILDKKGEDIRKLKDEELKEGIFILGDHDGLPQKELRRLKKIAIPVSIGPKMYFASQCVVIVNNELDIRGI
jgi:tRNA (pseudouridine54-N1)-methyltransferase